MATLIISVALALLISFTCSLMEAALYAVPWSAVERLRKSGGRTGLLLYQMRIDVERPIAAILTLNTIANTAGATIAGGAYLAVFGPGHMALFATAFTVLILAFGEIIPKTIGVAHATAIAQGLAVPLALLVRLFAPFIWLSSFLTRRVSPENKGPQISEDDIRAAADLSLRAGRIKPFEEDLVKNALSLDQKRVYDIMTPRTVVFSLPDDMTVEEACGDPRIWQFSRIPVYGDDNEDLVGLVERRTLAQCLAKDQEKKRLSDMMRPLHFVQESQTIDMLLRQMLKVHVHLFAVLDEYGGLAGVVSLEDVLEEILGSEIVDESDKVADLRALARERRRAFAPKAGPASAENDGEKA